MHEPLRCLRHAGCLACLSSLLLAQLTHADDGVLDKATGKAIAKKEIPGIWAFDDEATRKNWRESELKEEPKFQETTTALLNEYRDIYFDTRAKQVIMGDFGDETRTASFRVTGLLGRYNERWVISNDVVNPFDPEDIKFRPRKVFGYDLEKKHGRFNDGRALFRGKVMDLMVWSRLTETEFEARKAAGGSKGPVKPLTFEPEIELPRYKVASHEANDIILVAKVWIDTPEGSLPTEDQVRGVYKVLKTKTPKQLTLHFYVPGMELKSPAWIVASWNNESKVGIRRDDKQVPAKLRP